MRSLSMHKERPLTSLSEDKEDTVRLLSVNNIQVGVEGIVLHWCKKLLLQSY